MQPGSMIDVRLCGESISINTQTHRAHWQVDKDVVFTVDFSQPKMRDEKNATDGCSPPKRHIFWHEESIFA